MLFGWLAQAVNPALYEWQQRAQIHVSADPANCHFNLFPQWPGTPWVTATTARAC